MGASKLYSLDPFPLVDPITGVQQDLSSLHFPWPLQVHGKVRHATLPSRPGG